jgi:hypothetical protein
MLSQNAPTTAAVCIVGLGLALYGLYSRRNRSGLPLPPGPKKLPLVGNVFDIPATHPWETYMAWSKEYSTCRNKPDIEVLSPAYPPQIAIFCTWIWLVLLWSSYRRRRQQRPCSRNARRYIRTGTCSLHLYQILGERRYFEAATSNANGADGMGF